MTARNERRRFLRVLLFAAYIAVATLASEAMAMWASLSDQQLVQRSELIVVGTLIGFGRLQSGSLDLSIGVIQVDEVLKGQDSPIAFVALPTPEAPTSSTDISYKVGQVGLWYLRRRAASEQGIYLADHPQRFVPADQAQRAIAELRKLRVN